MAGEQPLPCPACHLMGHEVYRLKDGTVIVRCANCGLLVMTSGPDTKPLPNTPTVTPAAPYP